MKINVAKSAGFCFGVRRALKIAFEASNNEKELSMLGDIVHNEDVVKEIKASGVKKIKSLKKVVNKALLIRAHGMKQALIKKAKGLGYQIIDATCPMVKEIHKIAKNMENKGYKIIVIGDRQHDEVKGIIGQLKKSALITDKRVPLSNIKGIRKAAVVVQSTQDFERVLKIAKILKENIKDLKFFNTICEPTRKKQAEVRLMPLKNDVMIIIGSKASANTKRLYEISKTLNKRSHWINSKKDLKKSWFRGAKSVGITAGASTPDYITYQIIAAVKKIK